MIEGAFKVLMARSFADVHYFYGSPTAKPPHHRFDKGSYVYLFEHAEQRRARIEIANNAGTPEQDAFEGCESFPCLEDLYALAITDRNYRGSHG